MTCVALLGSEHSYYTGKIRAYLRHKGIEHEAVNATLEIFRQVILPNVGWAVVPVVVVDKELVIQDTAVIMDYFEKVRPERPVVPTASKQRAVSAIMELLGDEWLKMAAMHYRWSFPEQREYFAHEWDRGSNEAQHASASEEARAGNLEMARSMMSRFSGLLPVLGVSESTIPAVEATYLKFLDLFEQHLKSHRYLLGGSPCVGDFGLFGPLYAHLYRDPIPGQIMKLRAPHVAEWVERMYGASIPGHERPIRLVMDGKTIDISRGMNESFLGNDEIPKTLLPMLQMFFDEHVPILVSTVKAFETFLATNDSVTNEELPRGLGMIDFTIGGAKGQRMAFTFDVWKLERVLFSLDDESKAFLVSTFGPNAEILVNMKLKHRVVKRTNKPNRKSTLFLHNKL